jgi:hypothetical protein
MNDEEVGGAVEGDDLALELLTECGLRGDHHANRELLAAGLHGGRRPGGGWRGGEGRSCVGLLGDFGDRGVVDARASKNLEPVGKPAQGPFVQGQVVGPACANLRAHRTWRIGARLPAQSDRPARFGHSETTPRPRRQINVAARRPLPCNSAPRPLTQTAIDHPSLTRAHSLVGSGRQ